QGVFPKWGREIKPRCWLLLLFDLIAIENQCQRGAPLSGQAAVCPLWSQFFCLGRAVGIDKAALSHREPFTPGSEHRDIGSRFALLGLEAGENVAAGCL